MDDLLADFLTETNEALADCDAALLRLEQAPDDQATLGRIFRLVHTIKGTCGFLGLPRLERVAHAAENLLGRLRDGAEPPTPEHVTLVLRALDAVRGIVAGLGTTKAEPVGDDSSLIAALDAACCGHDMADRAPAAPARPSVEPDVPQTSRPESPSPLPQAAGGEVSAAAQTIRVHVAVLEHLMTLVSELVLTRNQLLQRGRHAQDTGLAGPLQRLSRITADLQDAVMKSRMQPIGHAWAKLPRLVRDLARDLGKRIELVQRGAETELDRQVLELIRDPLTHMVRNSADHGLEPPEERRAAGKPEAGRITLSAMHEGGHIIIEVADDGRGLPLERIRATALANGLASDAALARMTDLEIQQFIFHPGFSTAATVTAVSGRGVGMDVVKTNIEKIGGTIALRSTAGTGTSFTIRIPLTLAIVAGLIVEAGGERFAIPQLGVVELVRPGPAQNARIERINQTPVLRLRERLLPLVCLRRLLALDPPGVGAESDGFIVVVQVGPHCFGLIVDRLLDTEEIVVKPVAPILRHLTLFCGTTILGDGSVIMILDPSGIAVAAGVGSGRAAVAAPPPPAAPAADGDGALLLFRAGDAGRKAVPLALVSRLEDIPRSAIEHAGGSPVVQYRGRLMPLVATPGVDLSTPMQQVLVFADGERRIGLMVDAILDVVEDRLALDRAAARPGFLGTALIGGQASDVLDAGFWLRQAVRGRGDPGPAATASAASRAAPLCGGGSQMDGAA